MVVSLKALCLELDSILITYFEAFDETIKLQNELNALMKDGFLFMSKARANMGVRSLSTLQYPEDMSAQVKIRNVMQSSPDDFLEEVQFERDDKSEDTEDTNTEDNVLRHRGGCDGEKDQANAVEDLNITDAVEDLSISEDSKDKRTKDPIKWFGVLVPQVLRDSQSRFKKAAEISIDLASKKAEMELLRKKYHQLHMVKEDIINSE